MAALVAVVVLVLAMVVAAAASARAQNGEIPDPTGAADVPVLLIAQRDQGQVGSVPLTGGPVSVAAENVEQPQGVIRHGDTLFVSEAGFSDGRVVSVPVSGGEVTEVAADLNSPRGLLVVGQTLYIAESSENRVVSVPVGGGEVKEIVSGLDSPRDLDVVGDTLFIADRHNDRVVTAPLSGGAPTEFKAFDEEIGYLAVSGGMLYAAAMEGTVWSMPVADSDAEPEVVVSGLSGIRGLAIHGDTLYMGEAGGADSDDQIVSVPVTGGTPTVVAEVPGINDIAIGGGSCSQWSCVPLLGSLLGSLD